METSKDEFRTKMRRTIGSESTEIMNDEDNEGLSKISVDLPQKKQKKSGYLSCRCTRETEDTITALIKKTGLSQSEIVNHLVEISLPALCKKYLNRKH